MNGVFVRNNRFDVTGEQDLHNGRSLTQIDKPGNKTKYEVRI